MSFMLYMSREHLHNVALSTISGPRKIDDMVNQFTSCVLEAKDIAVPNVVPYRLKLSRDVSDLINFRNSCRRRWTHNKNHDLKKFISRLTNYIRLRA
jgi:hypothetical protein